MTFSIIATDPATGMVGVCQGTGSIAIASRCPQVAGSVAVTSQWHSDWRLGQRAWDLGQTGMEPRSIIAALETADPHFRYRQVGIVIDDGRVAAHTGDFVEGDLYAGHVVGDGYAALGNGVVGAGVLDAMAAQFESSPGLPFEERLMRSLEAGLAAGGEGRRHLSSAIITTTRGARRARLDLRVDIAPDGADSIHELRRIFDEYAPLVDYYADYWLDHPEVTSDQWLEAGKPLSR
ncbi:DUF1028 domain-containing protein [Microbacterium sp. KSW4-16]|uniref:DUF1028 domain-containing protein n=1 Tax=Microbacterium TaxID=33882 RepID=UPI001040AB11|nr:MULTISPECIES: DUF1028 domain-containing protein [Microbacterium]MCK8465592.1 DUF1028 domain-containing protein [Microbacterium aurugineum]TCJ29308.1 DUF1028 domain-containing protein [Microbacterium sp. PI-1]